MFLNFIDQYGIFFGLLIGVILGLVFAYLLFSRPKKITGNDSIDKDVKLENTENFVRRAPSKKAISTKPIEIDNENNSSETLELDTENQNIRNNEEKTIIDSFEEHNVEIETVQAINLNEGETPTKEKVIAQDIEVEPKAVVIEKKEAPPKPKKKTPKPTPKVKKEMGRYHVLFRKEDSLWYVKREGSERVVKVLHTQKEAIAFATIKAITQKTSIVIHKRDGKIRKQMY